MRTADEHSFERTFGCSERGKLIFAENNIVLRSVFISVVGDHFIVYQWSESYDCIWLHLFHIDDIQNSLQTFRLDVESRHEPNFFGLFHIFDDKLYFFSKFTNQQAANNESMVLNLGLLHVYDIGSGEKQIHTTSTLPSFYYSPPANVIRVVRVVWKHE